MDSPPKESKIHPQVMGSILYRATKKKEDFLSNPVTHIRRAEPQDGPTVISLVNALADYEKLPRPDQEGCQRLLRDTFGQHKRIDIFLAEVEGQSVGYAIVLETYSSFLALPTLYLEDIFVLPEYRGRHVGYSLFLFCAREALHRGCGRMEWMVLDWNELAHKFYGRLGSQRLREWVPYRMVRSEIEALVKPA
jgi:GNAT superfamily N-acetyltransferase